MNMCSLPKLIAVLAACVVALAFRLPGLGDRPFHGDEANQAVKAGILLETGRYEYDPHEHHGPTLYYGALPLLWLAGVDDINDATEAQFRWFPLLFGIGIILLLPLLPGLTALEVGFAALLMALSHGMVFYSRYYIQEMSLVFFALLAMGALLRWHAHPHWRWAALGGLALGLAHATKETSVLLGVGMVLAYAGACWLRPVPQEAAPSRVRLYVTGTAVAALVAFVVSVVLFSAFFTHLRGPLDSWLTYATYLSRAEGHGSAALHDKPWYYYFSLLAYTHRMEGPRWSEAFALALAAAGLVRAIFFPRSFANARAAHTLCFLALYALFVTAVYSLIPYKTPWNLLPFWQPLLLLAGVGAAWPFHASGAWSPMPRWAVRVTCALLLAAGAAHAGRQTYLGNQVYAADVRNPYVYAHTSTNLLRLVQRLEDLAAVSPKGKQLHVNILKPDGDYWPLPWYLRSFEHVGYWTQPPEVADADVIIADSRLGTYVEEHTADEYQFEFHALRPEVKLLVFIRKPLWDAFMETRR